MQCRGCNNIANDDKHELCVYCYNLFIDNDYKDLGLLKGVTTFAKEEHPKKGSKNDSNYMEKPPLDLLTLEFQVGTAQALGFGAAKYNRHNFKGGIDHSRLIAAAMRHLTKYNAGVDNDEESGLSHLSHAAASLNMLMWMVEHRPELDDRYKGDKK